MIKMIGIDHTTASVDLRSEFAFRKSEMVEAMTELKDICDATGIVILSTCNRMELWISTENIGADLIGAICQIRNVEKDKYEPYFIKRDEDEAIEHLMWMTGGLKSAIIAEDQILTQVKEAIDFSRQERLSDSVLDVLFRSAVTAAKKIKTDVVFHRANSSAIDQALTYMKDNDFSVEGKKCLVIGNGEYGRLVSDTLVSQGADVTVTIRQYHSGEVRIPKGCKAILYGEKYNVFPECELIVSATASPNYTLFYDKVKECDVKHPMILVDLAVPRDIDPMIKTIEGYTVFDIDDFKSAANPENDEAFKQAAAIIEEKRAEFHAWYDTRDLIPLIGQIRNEAVTDIDARLDKVIKKLELAEDKDAVLRSKIDDAAGKVISNLFYHMRDTLDEDTFRKCMRAMWENEDEV